MGGFGGGGYGAGGYGEAGGGSASSSGNGSERPLDGVTEGQFELDTKKLVETNDGSQAQWEDWYLDDPIAEDKELQDALVSLCKHFAGLDKYARRTEVMDARRQRFYRRGDQYINWNPSNWLFQTWPGASSGGNGSPAQDTPRYTDVYNIYWPYMRALISVGVQNPPGVNFEPDDPTKAVDIAKARNAETFRFHVDRVNQRKALQAEIMSIFCTDGRTVVYTRSVKDAQRFGKDDNGEPNSGELIKACGVLESKVIPVTATEQSDVVALFLSDEPEINLAKKTYPAYAANIKQGADAIGESAYERMARIGVLQGTRTLQNAGDAFSHLVTRHRVFLRPAAFNHAPTAVRDKLLEVFPDGCKVTTAGDAYCGSCSISMDDQMKIGFPAPGDGMSRASMMRDMVAVQDAFNDYKNLEKELYDHCIPVTYRAKVIGDIEAIREQVSEPGNYVDVEMPGGIASLADCFYREPDPSCPPALIAAYQDLMGTLGQFITGAQPALFGGADTHNETKGGIAMLRDQAMGQFSICWGALQELFAGMYKQAVLCRSKAAAKSGQKELAVKVPARRGKTMIAKVSMEALDKGNFHTYPDTDSSFPETTGSKRQTVMALVTQAMTNPVAMEAYGVLEPANLEIQRELLGVHDWEIPAANAGDKQMGEIELLLQQRPTPNLQKIQEYAADQAIEGAVAQVGQAHGIPIPGAPPPNALEMYQSSIPVDPKFDFHQFEYKALRDWLSSPDGIEEAKTNAWGVLNVKLHGLEHLANMGMNSDAPPGAPALPAAPGAAKPAAKPALVPQPGPMNAPLGAPIQ